MFQFEIDDTDDKDVLFLDMYTSQKQRKEKKELENIKNLSIKLLQYDDDQKVAEQELQNFREVLSCVRNIEHLSLEIYLKDKISVEMQTLIVQFLMQDIIAKYSYSITSLSISNSNLEKLHNSQTNQNGIEMFLISLFSQLNNLKSLSISEKLPSKEFLWKSIIKRVSRLLKNRVDLFQSLEFIDLDSGFDFGFLNVKKKSPQLFTELISLAENILPLNSMRRIQFCLQNLNLDKAFLNQFTLILSKFPHLIRLGLDISRNEYLKAEDLIQSIKNISNLSSTLEELVLIDCSVFSKKLVTEFSHHLKAFSKLTFLQLEELILNQGSVISFFNIFCNMEKLTTLIIDMREFDMKNDSEQAFKMLSNSCKELQTLDIQFPIKFPSNDQKISSFSIVLDSCAQTLQVLRISFSKKINYEFSHFFVQEICKLKNLKELLIQFYLKQEKTNIISVKSNLIKGAENIFDLRQINYYPYFMSQENSDFNDLLLTSIIKQQRVPLEVLHFENDSIGYNNESIPLKSLKFFQRNSMNSQYPAILIEKNQNQLKEIKMKHCININQYTQILNCNNLISLTFKIDSKMMKLDFKSLIEKLKLLQTLKVTSIAKQNTKNDLIDFRFLLCSQYLTNAKFQQVKSDNSWIISIASDKKSTILSLIVYRNIIEPYLTYQSNISHWDIYI